MKASPLAVFLTILVILFVVPGLFNIFFPSYYVDGYCPCGSFSGVQKTTNTTEIVYFGVITRDTRPSEMKIVIESGGWLAEYDMPSNDFSGPLTLVHTHGATYRNNITSIVYTDMAQDRITSIGDYITITLSHEGSESEVYGVWMVYVPLDTVIDDIFFTW